MVWEPWNISKYINFWVVGDFNKNICTILTKLSGDFLGEVCVIGWVTYMVTCPCTLASLLSQRGGALSFPNLICIKADRESVIIFTPGPDELLCGHGTVSTLCFLQLQCGHHTEHESFPWVVVCADLGSKLIGGIEYFGHSYQSKQTAVGCLFSSLLSVHLFRSCSLFWTKSWALWISERLEENPTCQCC